MDTIDKIIIENMGMNFGLSRTRKLLDSLGSPDDKLKIMHIAGTNGKGSIAQYLTCILVEAGLNVGTFTSPEVLDVTDQFLINGKPIKREKLNEYLSVALSLGKDCTSFELMTGGALYAFALQGCEYAVVECGLGGLYDATNAIHKKEIAVISSIGLEHTVILGDTIQKICAHKAGIIVNCPAVINDLMPPDARKFFLGKGKFAGPVYGIKSDNFKQSFKYDGREYEIHMSGPAQVYNAATAVEVARTLGINDEYIRAGLSKAFIPGRIQMIERNGNVYIVDGAHNPASFEPLLSVLQAFEAQNVTIIFGSLSDKDIDKNLQLLSSRSAKVVAVSAKGHRAMQIEKTEAVCKKYFSSVSVESSVTRALEISRGIVVVCGSFTLVKEALNWIEKKQ